MEDMEDCRLCSQSTNIFNLFFLNDAIKSKLSKTFKLHLKNDLFLPNSICQDCNDKLDDSFTFFNQISNVQLAIKGIQQNDDEEQCEMSFGIDSVIIKTEKFEDPVVRIESEEVSSELIEENDREHEILTDILIKIEPAPDDLRSRLRKRKQPEIIDNKKSSKVRKSVKKSKKSTEPFEDVDFKVPIELLMNSASKSRKEKNQKISKKSLKEQLTAQEEPTKKSKPQVSAKFFKSGKPKKSSKFSKSSKSLAVKRYRTPSKFFETIDTIYKKELKGKYTSDFLTLSIPSDEKLANGLLAPSAQLKCLNYKWSNFQWTCTENSCDSSFLNILDLDLHLKSTHQSKFTSNCSQCGIHSLNCASYATHIIKYHNSNARFSCLVCSEIYWSLESLYKHQKKSYEHKLNFCIYCGFYFNTIQTLRKHLVMVHKRENNRKFLSCDLCDYSSQYKEKLSAHVTVHKKYAEEICETCGAMFKGASNLAVHRQKVHYDKTKICVKCDECGKPFGSMLLFRKHKKNVHQGQDLKFECECGKKFNEKSKLQRHKMAHDPNAYRFQCPHCEKKFKYASGFNYHVRSSHTFEKPYSCPCCHIRFFDYANATKHIRGRHSSDLKPVKD